MNLYRYKFRKHSNCGTHPSRTKGHFNSLSLWQSILQLRREIYLKMLLKFSQWLYLSLKLVLLSKRFSSSENGRALQSENQHNLASSHSQSRIVYYLEVPLSNTLTIVNLNANRILKPGASVNLYLDLQLNPNDKASSQYPV